MSTNRKQSVRKADLYKRDKNAVQRPVPRRSPPRSSVSKRATAKHVPQKRVQRKTITLGPIVRQQRAQIRVPRPSPLKYLWALLLLPFLWAFAVGGWGIVSNAIALGSLRWFFYGLVAYTLIYPVLIGGNINFIETFEHELAHTIISFLTLRRITGFCATPGPGVVITEGGYGFQVIVSLAPYFLPVFTLPLLVVKPFTFSSVQHIIDFLIGVTLAFHYWGLLKEFGGYQSDISQHTTIFSFLFVLLLNIVFLVVILCIVAERYGLILPYFVNALSHTFFIYRSIFQRVQRVWLDIKTRYGPYVDLLLDS